MWQSFVNAFHGLRHSLFCDRNMTIITIIALLVIPAAVLLKVETTQLIVIIFLCLTIMALELINTALEKYMDFVTPDKSEPVRFAKDTLAGAVLLLSLGSVVIGILTFGPLIFRAWNGI